VTRPILLAVAATLGALPAIAHGQQLNPGAESRLGQLERSISEIRASIGRLQQQNQQLQQQMDRMKTSYEARLQRLEKAPARAPTPATRASQK
jgi:TolA-binding protein